MITIAELISEDLMILEKSVACLNTQMYSEWERSMVADAKKDLGQIKRPPMSSGSRLSLSCTRTMWVSQAIGI